MHEKNITTHTDLAYRLDMSKSQLSQMLSDDYQPLKTNVLKLMEVLDLSIEELTTEGSVKQLKLFELDEPEFLDRFDYQLNYYRSIENSKALRPYQVLETFAGAGGLALGLEQAGFNTKKAVEIDKDAAQTLKNNRPNWNVFEGDIHDFITGNLTKYKNIDLLSGGYPCQSFSYAGKRHGFEDTRGTLFYPFAQLLKEIQPKTFFAENVKGLVSHDNGNTLATMIKVFTEAGYQVNWNVLNAWDYGVAQKRQRIIIIGIRSDLVEKEIQPYAFPKPYKYKPVLRDALKNVPASEGMTYSIKKYNILKQVPPGGCWVNLPEEVAKDYLGASWHSGGGKRGMARRLSWDEPSLTLTTSPNQKQTERCHPDETRPFTVREYARIQNFPDEWNFSGSISSQYKQIGNAVPVGLSKAIGLSIASYLNQFEV